MFDNCKIYHSTVDFHELIDAGAKASIKYFNNAQAKVFNTKSLAFLLNEDREAFFTSSFEKAFVKHIKSAYQQILAGDIIEGVKTMKGSGFGLTPSGDDFICGMLYGLEVNAWMNNKNTRELKNKIFETAKGKNPISNAMLYYASIGRYNKKFKELQRSLLCSSNDIEEKLQLFLNHGETSGADMLTGYLLTINNNIGL